MTSPYICTKTVRKIAANLGDVLKRESGLIVVGNALNDCSLEIDSLRHQLDAQAKRIEAIVKQLESCGYECVAGPLRLNTAFIELKALTTDKEHADE
jgi:tRNA G26 N,N-dimethylase Trm1